MRMIVMALLAAALTACGSDDGPDDQATEVPSSAAQAAPTGTGSDDSSSAGIEEESAALDEVAQRYQEKVRARTRQSVVKSLAKQYGIGEDDVNCLLENTELIKLEDVESDPVVQAAFEKCGVDPSVAY